MYEILSSAAIVAPPRVVWDLLCDPVHYPDVVHSTDEMLAVPDGPLALGSVYRDRGGIPPFTGERTWRVAAFEPIRRQVHLGDDGSVRMRLEMRLEPTTAGCRYTQSFRVEPRWMLRPVLAVLWRMRMRARAQDAMDRTADGVRRLAEAQRPILDVV